MPAQGSALERWRTRSRNRPEGPAPKRRHGLAGLDNPAARTLGCCRRGCGATPQRPVMPGLNSGGHRLLTFRSIVDSRSSCTSDGPAANRSRVVPTHPAAIEPHKTCHNHPILCIYVSNLSSLPRRSHAKASQRSMLVYQKTFPDGETQYLSEWDAYNFEEEYTRECFRVARLAMKPRATWQPPDPKSETRNPKSETNPKHQCGNDRGVIRCCGRSCLMLRLRQLAAAIANVQLNSAYGPLVTRGLRPARQPRPAHRPLTTRYPFVVSAFQLLPQSRLQPY
jgi:hypothetical protein